MAGVAHTEPGTLIRVSRLGLLLVLAGTAGLALIAAALSATSAPGASAVAQTAFVIVPGQDGSGTGSITAPPNSTGGGGFAFPADGSVVRVGASTLSTTAQPGVSASAQGIAEVTGIALFGGEITVATVSARAGAAVGAVGAATDSSEVSVSGVVVLGQPATAGEGGQIPVADWGILETGTRTTTTSGLPNPSAESVVTGLRLRLVAEHAGLPAGTEIVVGRAEARARADSPPAPPPATAQPGGPGGGGGTPNPKPAPNAPKEPGTSVPGAPKQLVRAAPEVEARLTQGGYVFPVAGPAAYGDTFGAYRGDVAGKWHHGEDIVAPFGTPLLAVADGTLFSVGWNDIGGWRFWLRDTAGNEFYYAHLSAYSPLAQDGRRVRAGDVIGFVGTSGDAEGGVPHLHFEIHPVNLLSLGYDGVVAPYPFLVAWQRAQDVAFAEGRVFDGQTGGLPTAAFRAGAVLLEASDISQASGLVPGALDRAVAPTKAQRSP